MSLGAAVDGRGYTRVRGARRRRGMHRPRPGARRADMGLGQLVVVERPPCRSGPACSASPPASLTMRRRPERLRARQRPPRTTIAGTAARPRRRRRSTRRTRRRTEPHVQRHAGRRLREAREVRPTCGDVLGRRVAYRADHVEAGRAVASDRECLDGAVEPLGRLQEPGADEHGPSPAIPSAPWPRRARAATWHGGAVHAVRDERAADPAKSYVAFAGPRVRRRCGTARARPAERQRAAARSPAATGSAGRPRARTIAVAGRRERQPQQRPRRRDLLTAPRAAAGSTAPAGSGRRSRSTPRRRSARPRGNAPARQEFARYVAGAVRRRQDGHLVRRPRAARPPGRGVRADAAVARRVRRHDRAPPRHAPRRVTAARFGTPRGSRPVPGSPRRAPT